MRVTCVVPVYNGERFLKEALDSILAQSHTDLEIIVVDDGSTDATPAIVASYGKRVVYERQGNRGPAAARNRGVRLATSELVAFLDSDDTWYPDKLARQLAVLLARPDVDLCLTQYLNHWAPELAEEEKRYADHPLSKPSSSFNINTLLARRSVFERTAFNEELQHGENTDWFLKVTKQGVRAEVIPEVLARRRFHPDSMTRTSGNEPQEGLLQNLKAWLDNRRQAPV